MPFFGKTSPGCLVACDLSLNMPIVRNKIELFVEMNCWELLRFYHSFPCQLLASNHPKYHCRLDSAHLHDLESYFRFHCRPWCRLFVAFSASLPWRVLAPVDSLLMRLVIERWHLIQLMNSLEHELDRAGHYSMAIDSIHLQPLALEQNAIHLV